MEDLEIENRLRDFFSFTNFLTNSHLLKYLFKPACFKRTFLYLKEEGK